MAIRGDRDPYDGQHPLVRIHEGNGRPALFSTLGYVQGVVDMEDDEARSLLREIHEHQIDDAVIYLPNHPGMCSDNIDRLAATVRSILRPK